MQIRRASKSDAEELADLARRSVLGLSSEFYSDSQIVSASRCITTPDIDLLEDGTMFVAVSDEGLLGCGAWSKRRKLYTGSEHGEDARGYLDPAVDAARIRAFFVDPAAVRTGVARALFAACREDAMNHGFKRFELMATLPGVPLYEKLGFSALEPASLLLTDGTSLPALNMRLDLSP